MIANYVLSSEELAHIEYLRALKAYALAARHEAARVETSPALELWIGGYIFHSVEGRLAIDRLTESEAKTLTHRC